METIEVLEEKPRKEDKKEKIVRKIKWAMDTSDRLVDELYGLLELEAVAKKDEAEFIDIIVAAKGISKALGDVLSRHSDLDAKIRKKIDEESDAFAEGLMGDDKKGYAKIVSEER